MRKVQGHEKARGVLGAAGLALLGVIALGIGLPAHAAPTSMSGAEKLRRLDVMLKQSDARCRGTADSFHPDYVAFSSSHRYALARARRELGLELARRYGTTGSRVARDRASAVIARDYRRSHPWLSCRDLKTVTQGLADVVGSAPLLEAADQILPPGSSNLAYLSR